MKVTNEIVDLILSGAILHTDLEGRSGPELLRVLASDLKEARSRPKQIVRSPLLVLTAGVVQPTRVESLLQLKMAVPEPYATMLEARARAAATALAGSEPFPLMLVPRMGLWVLQLNDMRSDNPEQLTAVGRGESLEDLSLFIARERVEPYKDSDHAGVPVWKKVFRRDGPLEWYNPPKNNDCFVNVAENMDTYMAHAIATIPPVKEL